ncbi:MAG: hypothetical protein BGO01_09020 [Armatimonadetes bacterium 55-13]|jgi:hypothetical protein|nr:hypothetical protein [Armatimonadota bacterium]ODU53803.1 MAG: hypothetical protein ABT09_01075 [bacterium SCN 57-13]OJU62003.1 MAG: hypothetical protein BGO01_09020 [Armatimonadetes bacterium 55-13]
MLAALALVVVSVGKVLIHGIWASPDTRSLYEFRADGGFTLVVRYPNEKTYRIIYIENGRYEYRNDGNLDLTRTEVLPKGVEKGFQRNQPKRVLVVAPTKHPNRLLLDHATWTRTKKIKVPHSLSEAEKLGYVQD